MSRQTLSIKNFNRGIDTNINPYSENTVHFLSLDGFKFSNRKGSLEEVGGYDGWITSNSITYVNGLKRWYRSDGGKSTIVTYGGQAYYLTEHNKTLNSLYNYGAAATNCNNEFPVLWESCGHTLIGIPYNQVDRPFCIFQGWNPTPEGGLDARLLGLDVPALPTHDRSTQQTAFVCGAQEDHSVDSGLIDGTYGYKLSYSYGTREFPELYGESALTQPIFILLDKNNSDTQKRGIIQITIPLLDVNGVRTRVNVYRTLKDDTINFYKIGYVPLDARKSTYNDAKTDSLVDTDEVPPIYTGMATGMICAKWHSGLQRLFWWGWDGYLHWSAAGYPHINPPLQKMSVGDIAKLGCGIAIIRDNIYGFKEDGIYLITGNSPNYIWKRISGVYCTGRASIVEIDDIVYFLGVLPNNSQVTVYAFDGNSVQDIGSSIWSILGKKNQLRLDKAYAKSVNGEYWLCYSTDNKYYCNRPVYYNNILLKFISGSGWINQSVQASTIEICDGYGDSGDILITESEISAVTGKAVLSRHEPYYGKVYRTTYDASFNKVYGSIVIDSTIRIGVFPALSTSSFSFYTKVGNISALMIHDFKIKTKVRNRESSDISAIIYDDSEVLDSNQIAYIGSNITFESSERLSTDILATTGVTAPKWDVGAWNNFYAHTLIYDIFKFTVIDVEHRYGIILDIKFNMGTDYAGHLPALVDSIEMDYTLED